MQQVRAQFPSPHRNTYGYMNLSTFICMVLLHLRVQYTGSQWILCAPNPLWGWKLWYNPHKHIRSSCWNRLSLWVRPSNCTVNWTYFIVYWQKWVCGVVWCGEWCHIQSRFGWKPTGNNCGQWHQCCWLADCRVISEPIMRVNPCRWPGCWLGVTENLLGWCCLGKNWSDGPQ